ncbi:hypothetical protein [Chitiniphilus eburneus]|uniref:Uncharacterized protein n=1 Tax=Chitiniphilus eburneus TaxID=2571148 RepID=A0A4U0QBW9_9NEIS|nr:hypothetical protein [Chitiniphilus eburneus]TJZ78786.1 hypothetical protein FAZ21_00405 [Chitiniphilus eburneus]
MLKSIDSKLRAWAIWSLIREDGGSGYVQFSYRERSGGGDCRSYAPSDADGVIVVSGCDGREQVIDYEEIRTLDALIHSKLSLSSRQLFKVWYLGRGTTRQRAEQMSCSEKTAFRHLDRSHHELEKLLLEQRYGSRSVSSHDGIQY